ncbi:hypothetical protein HZZ00_18770 [Streptomyces sp. NEAU-sy36]|uniref:hypothetical protein n=1 Tax=unclassified Streptomyces TaxID=2593676 RepID=UPI0015D63E2D|nr:MULTISPECIES: hypothetical protein [unclassified Streptomyces]QLJ02851.1 hypothetical protein HZZ00_18770 [Streptomyces sp. NEAU-sy36]
MWELLHEALHAPAHRCKDGTTTYTSSLLGVPVARDSLLGLAGLLTSSGSDLKDRSLRLEGHDEEGSVLAETARRARRFRLGHGYWSRVYQLCRLSGCGDEPYWYRTLCDAHMTAAGAVAVREETRMVAEGLRMDRDYTDYSGSESMRQLMEAALAVGIPAAEHARYFAECLHLPDPDTAEDWDYDEHEHEIREDEVRLLRSVGAQPQQKLAPTSRSAARQIGPIDPLQLPGSPDHLILDFSCTTGGLPSCEPEDTIHYWHVGVHHRLPQGASQAEQDLGQVGRLLLVKTGWRQDSQLLRSDDDAFRADLTAEAAFDAVDDPHSPIHRLGVGEDGDLLLLLNVELDPAWRGFGLGAFLTTQALKVLGRDCRVVATCVDEMDSPVGRLVQTAGFHPVGPHLAVLDRSRGRQDEQTARLHRSHRELLVSLSSPNRSALPPS